MAHKNRLLIWMAVAIVSACASSETNNSRGAFTTVPYRTLLTDSGNFALALWTAPEQPPSRGVNRVKLEVTDANTSAAVAGLDISAVPWMPSMGHGTSAVPAVTEQGLGVYLAENVNFFMPATWQLRMTFSSETDGATGVTDSAAPSFDIP